MPGSSPRLWTEEKFEPQHSCHAASSSGCGRRSAFVISSHAFRYALTRSHLLAAGFSPVRRVRPVPLDDPELRKITVQQGDGFEAKTHSLTLSHARLWRAFPAQDEDWAYIFEDDVFLEPHVRGADVQCLLSRAESVARTPTPRRRGDVGRDRNSSAGVRGGSPGEVTLGAARSSAQHEPPRLPFMLFLGHCEADVPERTSPHGASLSVPLACGHTARPCAPLCLHAYALHRSERGLSIPSARGRRAMDVRVRKHFQSYREPWQRWPLCLDWFERPPSGLFGQNKSLAVDYATPTAASPAAGEGGRHA